MIQCYSEVFNQKFPMLFTEGMDHHSPWVREYRQRDPLHFLNEFVFGPYPSQTHAVGFKIFPEHFADGRFQPVVDQVLRDPSICLFHLRRNNKMATLLSLRRAQLTNVWSDPGGRKQQIAPLEFSVEECEQFFNDMAESEGQIDALLESRGDCHQLRYEDLVGDLDRSIIAFQDALGTEVLPLTPGLRKQNTTPLSAGIANFKQLNVAFARTPWHEYFEDPSPTQTPLS